MAENRTLDQYAGQRLYRNSLDDILDQVQQDIKNERSIAQARRNVIINSEDPTKKLKEVQAVEKNVAQEDPAVRDTVLQQTYQAPQTQPRQLYDPQSSRFTLGKADTEEISQDELKFYSEVEKIQDVFDSVYQEKLKTAQEIPSRTVVNQAFGGTQTVPGTSKEDIAKNQTIEELEKQGVLNPSLSRDLKSFIYSAIPIGGLTPREQAEQSFYPVRSALSTLPGVFTGFGITSKAVQAPKIAQAGEKMVRRTTKLGNFLSRKGINTVKAGKFTASALSGGGVMGAYSAIDQIDEDSSIADKAKIIVGEGIFGAGFGFTGAFNNKGTKALAESTYGFVTAKLGQGASTEEALLNGLMFAGFGILNKANMRDVEKGIAIREFKKVGDESFNFIQNLRSQNGLKPFTKLQKKQWEKTLNKYAERFRYEKYSPEQIKKDTEEFISRFLTTNDPKGAVVKVRQMGNQIRTQSLQARAKAKKEAVSIPTTGKADIAGPDNLVKMSLTQQVNELKGLGYTEEQLVQLGGKERGEIIANSIKPVNYYGKEQPAKPDPELIVDKVMPQEKTDTPEPEIIQKEEQPVKKSKWYLNDEEFKKLQFTSTLDDLKDVMELFTVGGTYKSKEIAEKIRNELDPNDPKAKEMYNILTRSKNYIRDTRGRSDEGASTTYGDVFYLSENQLKAEKEEEKKRQEAFQKKTRKQKAKIFEKRERAKFLKRNFGTQADLEIGEKKDTDKLINEGLKATYKPKTVEEYVSGLKKLKKERYPGIKAVQENIDYLLNKVDKSLLPRVVERLKEINEKGDDSKFDDFTYHKIPYYQKLINSIRINVFHVANAQFRLDKGSPKSSQERLNQSIEKLNLLLKGDVNASRNIVTYRPDDIEKGLEEGIIKPYKDNYVWVDTGEVVDIDLNPTGEIIGREAPVKKMPKGDATGLKSTVLKPSQVEIDESKFQPREEYNQAIIDDIAENFDPKKWDEPIVWQDPETDKYFVVSGHHRHQGVVKGNYESATYKVLPKGTTLDEAINMSEEGNLARTEQSAFENSKVVRRRHDKGDSLAKIARDLPGLTKAQSSAGQSSAIGKLLNLSYLDQNGKFKNNYENVNEFPRIQSISSFVGGLRKNYDWFPNKYEDDIFTYLYAEDGIKGDSGEFKLNLDRSMERLDAMEADKRPGSIIKQLRKGPIQPKEGTDDAILQEINDLRQTIENLKNKTHTQLKSEAKEKNVTLLTIKKRDNRQIRKLRGELKFLIEKTSEPDPNQLTLAEPIDQYNMFGGIDLLPDVSKKNKQILDDLHIELSNINREQLFLFKQISDKKINALKAKKMQKDLEKRYSTVIKKMQKIDKPVNGAKAKPGISFDINKQIQLDFGNKKQSELFRETATKEDKENTKKLQRDLSRLGSRLGITERASSIIAPLKNVGGSYFIGQKVSGPEELALISQIVRDKRYETFRIFFTKTQGVKDKIVNYTAYTNRMPGWVNVFPGPFARDPYDRESNVAGLEALTQWMYKAMQDSGADGYYLLHNHPSGKIKASKADINITKKIANNMPGFKGHVIINHNKYGLIDSNQNVKELKFDKENQSELDPLINEKYYETMPMYFSTKKISVLKRFQEQENVVSIFATDYQQRIHSITELPLQNFINVGKTRKYGFGLARIKTQLRKIASTYGGQRLFLVSKSTDITGKEIDYVYKVWKRLFKDNFITDGYFFNSYEDPSNFVSLSFSMGRKRTKGKLDFNPGAEVPRLLKEQSTPNRNIHIEGLEAKAEADGITLDLSYNDKLKSVRLHLIKIPKDKRNQGLGTKTMRKVLDYVDDQGLMMSLTTSSEFGSSKRRLIEFYKSFGFRLNSGPYRDLRFKDTMIRKPYKSLNIKEQVQSLDEFKRQSNFANWFGNSKIVDIDGKPEVFYHGTQRPDRVGSVFYKSRAFSGPMSYFTNDPEIASGYAKGKSDDSLVVDDWSNLYSKGRSKGLRSAWWELSDKEKNNFHDIVWKIAWDGQDLSFDENFRYMNARTYDYFLKEAKGNGFIAIFKAWIEGGNFINKEEKLLDVFKMAGVENMRYDNPRAKMPSVYPVYLSMQNPLNTDNIPNKIVEGLRKRSRRQPFPKYTQGSPWDKELKKPEDWMWMLDEDIKHNTTTAWTSIPDWVTRYLKQQGYDGILDLGNKYSDPYLDPHRVAIPFEPNQVKSKFNRGTFSKRSKNIMKDEGKALKSSASTLSSIKQLKTKSPEFKKWFKGSKVVDENGKPLVVYHGTKTEGGFEEFTSKLSPRNQKGNQFYFSDNAMIANRYAKNPYGFDGSIFPVYLSFQNPLIIDAKGDFWSSSSLSDQIKKSKKEHDSVIIKNVKDSGGIQNQYIAFEPTQIKSIFNKGEFSQESKSIMKDEGKALKSSASTLSSIKQLETKSEVPQKIYKDVKKKSALEIAKERKKEIKRPGIMGKALTPLSTRLRVINPVLKRTIRRFEANVSINTSKDLAVVESFMKQTDKLRRKNKDDYAVLDLAMKNSDIKMAEKILKKHNMGNEFVKVRNLLDNLYYRAESVGYEPNYLSEYFPRRIKDSEGLMLFLETTDSWGIIQSNIKEKEKELGRRLENEERLKMINSLIRGYGGKIGITKPANLKEREIEYLDDSLNEFYYDSNTALHNYIVKMNEAIEIKRFFGKGLGPDDPNVQIDNNVIGEYVDDLLKRKIIKPHHQDELVHLLRIRFNQGVMDPTFVFLRQSSYLMTMGQISSAVTQIGDLAFSAYSGGALGTLKQVGVSAVGKSKITRKDLGVEKIAQEFTDSGATSKILDKVFTYTGLKYIDSIGKESLMNSTISRFQKQAQKGKFTSVMEDRLNEAFSKEELPAIIKDLKSGKITDDIKYLAFYTLSDFQPVTLSEMPEFYLNAPNGRIMYMLKSYTMKMFDVARNEAFKKINEGKTVKDKTEGLRRLIYLAGTLMLTGMSADQIKNYIYGREQTWDEVVSDNLFKLIGFQKYLAWHFKRYRNVGWTAIKGLLPPVGPLNPLIESFVRDLFKYHKTLKKGEDFKIPGDTETIKNLPIVGKLYYNYFGNGEKFHKKRKEKAKSKKIKKRSFNLQEMGY
jgi:GNAT superfamily N-acetyltransferase